MLKISIELIHYEFTEKTTMTVMLYCKFPIGHYMYTETSSPRKQGDKARLASKTYPATNGMCLSFWYHMYGNSIGTLNVYTSTFSRLGSPVWALYGNQGNNWRKAQTTIQTATQFQVLYSVLFKLSIIL